MIFNDRIKQAKQVKIIPLYKGELKNAHGLLKGLCPIHEEATPSFVIYPATNSFHCFGCGKGGDVITYLMAVKNLTFVEAIRELLK